MKIGFVVNDIDTETEGYTTTRLAIAAINAGHEAWIMTPGDFAYDPDEMVKARAKHAPKDKYTSGASYLHGLRGPNARTRRITVDDLDVLMLRNDPSQDVETPWRQNAAIEFGRLAMRNGVVVLNDPNGLAKAITKMYFEEFPEEVRPRTLITRDRDEIKEFVKDKGHYAAFRRMRQGDDIRSNVHAGGEIAQATITERDLRICEIVRPKLVADGMFLVGLDIVGDKLMEVNVFSPGGLGSAQSFEKVNFAQGAIGALERKVDYMSSYRRRFSNVQMNTL